MRACHNRSVSAEGPSTSTGTSRPDQLAIARARNLAAASPSAGACDCKWSRASTLPSSAKACAGVFIGIRKDAQPVELRGLHETGTALRNPHRSRPESRRSCWCGSPRREWCARMRSISFRKISPCAPRFMRFSTRGAGVLQRHVDVFHQRRVLGDGVEQLLRDLVRISSTESEPTSACGVSICARRASSCARPSFMPEILAVAGGILADQIDLAHALREQPRGFRQSPIRSGGCGICRDTAESRRRCRDGRSLRRS